MAVRLPQEVEKAARMACRFIGIRMSDLLRLGVETALASAIPKFTEIARDPTANPRKRIQAIEWLHQGARASLALHESLETVQAMREARKKAARISRRAARKKPRRGDRVHPEGIAGDQGAENRQDQAMFGTAADPRQASPWGPLQHDPTDSEITPQPSPVNHG